MGENDLTGIIEYVADESPSNTLKIFNRIKLKVSMLYTLPERGRIVPELCDQGIFEYRRTNHPSLENPLPNIRKMGLRVIRPGFTAEY